MNIAWYYHVAPVKWKKTNALWWNILFTFSCYNFNFVVIYAIFPPNPNSQICLLHLWLWGQWKCAILKFIVIKWMIALVASMWRIVKVVTQASGALILAHILGKFLLHLWWLLHLPIWVPFWVPFGSIHGSHFGSHSFMCWLLFWILFWLLF